MSDKHMTVDDFESRLTGFLDSYAVDEDKIDYYEDIYSLMPEEFRDQYYTVYLSGKAFVDGPAFERMSFTVLWWQIKEFAENADNADLEISYDKGKAFLDRIEEDFWSGAIADNEWAE